MSMQAIINTSTDISTSIIYAMRGSGATLQEIADRIGKSKERVRQIFKRNYGSTKHGLISTEQLCKELNLSRRRIIKLYQDSVITPVREWGTSSSRYLLWHPATVGKVKRYYTTGRLCKICRSSIPRNRRHYCSQQCYKEGHKYKYKSVEARHRHMESIKRYRVRRKQLVPAIM